MPKKQFITIGLNPCLDVNCLVDELKSDDIIRVKLKKITAGGKAFNVAKFLHKYNQHIKPIGVIGGHNGIRFKNLLLKENITADYLIEIDGEIRENYNFFLKMVLS